MKVCQHQVNAEEIRLRQLLTQKERILQSINRVKKEIRRNEIQKSEKKEFTSIEILVIISYLKSLKHRVLKMTDQLAALENRITEQRNRLIEARRRLKPVEKLKERRREQFRIEVDRELQAMVDELHLIRLNQDTSFEFGDV
jgi:flagellar export protein FliJ